ncbi:MAG: O-antigen ligase family protein [Phycisphaerae bacterium]|nr:O-antigen ligase family protein [Phycisphaerae bacterium]
MRFALYLAILIALMPLVFSRPFFGLCVYYVVSLLQPKYLCWRPDLQDALLVGVPLVVGAVAIGARRRELVPEWDLYSGRLLSLRTRIVSSALIQPRWGILLLGLLIAYVAVTRTMAPFPLSHTSYQFSGLCKVLLVAAMITGLVTTPRQFRALFLVIAMATSFWAIKGGLKVMMIGPHQVYGRTYDNNLFALTSVMTLPMVFYFGLTVKSVRWRAFLLICAALICLGIIGSRSRAGFVAFGVVLMCMAWSSKYRLRALIAVLLVATVTTFMSGTEILDRLDSIFAYSEDQSARSRFFTWLFAWQLFLDNPLFGVGFGNYEIAKIALGGGNKSAHNIFLQNLAELGAIGSLIWCAVVFGSMYSLQQLMRWSRRLPTDMRWVYNCARGLLLGLLAFCIHGFFHNESYIELMFVLVALTISLRLVAERQWHEMRLHAEWASAPGPVVSSTPDREHVAASPPDEIAGQLQPPTAPEVSGEGPHRRPRSLGELARFGARFRPSTG